MKLKMWFMYVCIYVCGTAMGKITTDLSGQREVQDNLRLQGVQSELLIRQRAVQQKIDEINKEIEQIERDIEDKKTRSEWLLLGTEEDRKKKSENLMYKVQRLLEDKNELLRERMFENNRNYERPRREIREEIQRIEEEEQRLREEEQRLREENQRIEEENQRIEEEIQRYKKWNYWGKWVVGGLGIVAALLWGSTGYDYYNSWNKKNQDIKLFNPLATYKNILEPGWSSLGKVIKHFSHGAPERNTSMFSGKYYDFFKNDKK